MRILSVTHQYPPYNKGGMAKHIESLFEALSQKDIKIDIITLGHKKEPKKNQENIKIKYIKPIFPVDALNKFYFILRARKASRNLISKNNYDAVLSHVNDGVLVDTKNIPLIVKLHTLWEPQRQLYKGILGKLYLNAEVYMEKKVLEKSEKVISVSQMVKNDVKEIYGVESIVHDNAVANIFNDDFDSEKIPDDKKNNIIIVGDFIKRKGCHLIPEILEEFKNEDRIPKLLHIGEIKDKKLLQKVKNRLKSQGMSGKLETKGYLTRKELIQYYMTSKLLIHPAIYDPSPKAPIEALSCNTKVIVSENTGGYRKLKQETDSVYISSIENFPKKVKKIFQSDSKMNNEIKLIRSWEEVAEDTIELIKEI